METRGKVYEDGVELLCGLRDDNGQFIDAQE
jgi:hypothetical protein